MNRSSPSLIALPSHLPSDQSPTSDVLSSDVGKLISRPANYATASNLQIKFHSLKLRLKILPASSAYKTPARWLFGPLWIPVWMWDFSSDPSLLVCKRVEFNRLNSFGRNQICMEKKKGSTACRLNQKYQFISSVSRIFISGQEEKDWPHSLAASHMALTVARKLNTAMKKLVIETKEGFPKLLILKDLWLRNGYKVLTLLLSGVFRRIHIAVQHKGHRNTFFAFTCQWT